MPRSSRFAATILTGILSLVVLGGVWAAVVLLLPTNYDGPVLMTPQVLFIPGGPAPSPDVPMVKSDSEESSTLWLPPPDPLPTPPPAAQAGRAGPSIPVGLELKCEEEMSTACPEGALEERRRCIQATLRQLSGPCQQRAREHLVRMKANLQQIQSACEPDARRFCRDVPIGGGAVVQCLETHAQEVSDQCFQVLPRKGRLLN
ncbi:MAG: cysteine rich repeat-containing protein [Nitrospiraceae bacterium]